MTWEKRDFHGYEQHREVTITRASRWAFYLPGVGKNDCSVLMSDGSFERVPMDKENRITVLGKKYSSRHWYLRGQKP